MRRLAAAASLALLLTLPADAGRGRNHLITPLSIGQGRLAQTRATYTKAFGKPLRTDALPGRLIRVTHPGKVGVYFRKGRSRALAIVVTGAAFQTAKGVGPCSSERAVKRSYPGAVRVWLGRDYAYRLGSGLWFEIRSGRVVAMALGAKKAAIETAGASACGGKREILLPPGKGTVWNGVYLKAAGKVVTHSEISEYEVQIGKKIASQLIFLGWYGGALDTVRRQLEITSPLGITGQIAWMPSIPSGGDPLAAILSGSQNAIIDGFARQAKRYGKPFFLRFAPEMNGDWEEYGPRNGRDPAELVQAWRYVWKRFRAIGATNAVWVWSPNWDSSPNEPWNDLHAYYPGDRYVDWVGVDFYGLKWEDVPVSAQIDSVYADFSYKPVMIAETATADCANYIAGATDTKDQWIREFFAELKKHPVVRAFYWFNIDKEADWRVGSCPHPAAQNAYKRGVSSPRFLSRASN
jgi:hypothetical protein